MSYYRRPERLLDSLLRWRRNVFLQSPGGGYVLVSATRYVLTLHHFDGSLRHDPTHTEHLAPIPGLFDGNGWNLASLKKIESSFSQNDQIQSEENQMPENQQPYVALYCKPTRDSISKMSDAEAKVFLALATYADDQGVCFPGVRVLSEYTGKSVTEVSEALQGLSRKGFMIYLRHKAVDPITRKAQPDVYGLSPSLIALRTDSGIQTYMLEFLNQNYGENLHNQTPESNTKNPESESNASNHHHHQTPESAHTREMPNQKPLESGNSGKAQDYANQSPQPAAQPQPARSAPKESENDLPPRDAGPLEAYAVPLAAIDQEAYANEMRHLVSGLQLAKARQLVSVYGIDMCGIAIRLLAKQPFKSVDNPPGWIINKLRQGALVAADGKGELDDFINS